MENRGISFQKSIEKAISGSVEHVEFLSSSAKDPALRRVILPIFIDHLNPALIPKQIIPETTNVINLAKWSLLGIIQLGAGLLESEEQVFDPVVKNWARLYPWIPFFYRNFLADLSVARTQLNSPVSISHAAKITIGFLGVLYDKFPSVHSRITNTPALRTTIMGIWILATDLQHQDIAVGHASQSSAGALSFLRETINRVVAYCLGSNATIAIFPAFVAAAGGISVVVVTTLKYLRLFRKEVEGSASKDQPLLMHSSWLRYTADFAQITQILLNVSKREETAREEFISRGSVHIMASILARLRPKLPYDPFDDTYPRGYEYILYATLESDDSVSVLCEALNARILETILQAGHIESKHTPYHRRDQDSSDVALLSQLPHLLMHTKVLRVAAKSLSWIKSQDIERHARHDKILLSAWDNVKGAVARYLQTEKRLRSIKRPIYESACGGDQECISRDETSPELYRCSGCLTVKYCSRHCQRADWKRRHRYHCPLVRLAIGTYASHDIRRNIPMIVAIETEERIPENASFARVFDGARIAPDDYGELVAELDLTVYPFIHSVNPLGRYRNILVKAQYEEILHMLRSTSSGIFDIVKLRQGNTVHYLLSPGTLLKDIFDWPPTEVTFPTFRSLLLSTSTTP